MSYTLTDQINKQEVKALAHTSDLGITRSHPQAAEDKSATGNESETKKSEFKAVGVIQGEVDVNLGSLYSVTVNGIKYRLKSASTKLQVLWALRAEIKTTGSNFQRLIVYPRMIHFPVRDQRPVLHFELVGFQGHAVQDLGIFNDLTDFEFKLSGLWQFIPVCRVPCVSIFRNFSEERKLFIKSAEPFVRVRFLKASHIPLSWKDSHVLPFRFNPKLPKDQDQGHPMFVQVRAKFIPERDQFSFIEQLGEPLAEPPRFLKADKSDKGKQRENMVVFTTPQPLKRKPVEKPKLPPVKRVKENQ